MLFDQFIEYIPKIRKQQLPSAAAHAKMVPKERLSAQDPEYYKSLNPRRSAVMMLFYPKAGAAHLALIKRNAYDGVHSSQISFPGGKVEPDDIDLADTALRETFEEIGVHPAEIDVVMPFTEIYIPPSNFLVAPFLGVAINQPVFNPNPQEVQLLIELPVSTFLDDSIVVNAELQTSYALKMTVPAFKVDEHIIWGATAMILSELKETIKSII